MLQFQPVLRSIAAILVCVMAFESSAAFAAPRALDTEVKTLRSTIERGGSADAIEKALDEFGQRLVKNQVTMKEIEAFVKARTTAREYREFQVRLAASLKGIDPSSLKPEELTGVLLEGLGRTRSDGLSWSGCVGLSLGVTAIIIALVVWFSSTVKVKSDEEIKTDYIRRRASTNSSADSSIKWYQTWETSIPGSIRSAEREIRDLNYRLTTIGSDISAAESRVRSAEFDLSRIDANNPDNSFALQTARDEVDRRRRELDAFITELNEIPGRIRSEENSIDSLRARFARYTANPQLAIDDANAVDIRRHQRLAELDAEELAAIAAIPGELARQQERQRRNRTWAAVGAAIATYFVVDGAIDAAQGECQE